MEVKEMKVLHGLVNYGTQAGMLALGLRNKGVDSISVVTHDTSKRIIDIDIQDACYHKNAFVRKWRKLKLIFSLFRNNNIFHFYFGKTLLPYNLDIPFYHLFGKKIIMEYLGTDIDLWLGYNGTDWRNRPIDRVELVKRVIRQAKQFDRQLVCSPHLYEFVDNSIILPLALDLSSYAYTPIDFSKKKKLTFMHCPTDRTAKKSDYIEAALNRLKSKGYDFNYKCVTNVTHSQLKEEYLTSDVVIDQLNFWYGTVSVEAMALGRPVVSGYRSHLCHYDKRFENLPIINADIYNVYNVLKDILDGKYDLSEIGMKSREFAMRTHDLSQLTEQLIDIYKNL